MNDNQQPLLKEIYSFIEGDKGSFREIYLCYKDRIYYYALKITKSKELAEEVVQDVFVKLWANRAKIDTQYNFSSFVFKIAHNHAINILKRISYERTAHHRISRTYSTSTTNTEDTVVYNEYLLLMNNAVQLLPPKRKNIFNLSRTQGVSHDEIALMMGISKNTVKSQLVKATKFIRNYFATEAGMTL